MVGKKHTNKRTAKKRGKRGTRKNVRKGGIGVSPAAQGTVPTTTVSTVDYCCGYPGEIKMNKCSKKGPQGCWVSSTLTCDSTARPPFDAKDVNYYDSEKRMYVNKEGIPVDPTKDDKGRFRKVRKCKVDGKGPEIGQLYVSA